MALLQKTLRLLVLTAMATASALSWADQPYHPFAEPMSFDPDWQFFAPVDIQELEDLTARQRANYGWYLTYDRLNIGLDRPLISPENTKFDTGWGNLWTFGVMNDDEKGWDFQFLHITGPNAYERIRVTRSVGVASTSQEPNFPGNANLAERYAFDDAFGNGTLQVGNSLNVASLGSFEINRKWRREPYQYGGYIEPLLGVRYMDFTDRNSILAFSGYTDTLGSHDVFDISDIINKNRMVLGQIGFRYFRDSGRFQFSTEFKALGGGNFQTGSVNTQHYDYAYGGSPDLVAQLLPTYRLTNAPGLSDKLVAGMDTRMQIGYNITKNINFRFGLSFLYIGSGIARGSQIRGNNPSGPLGDTPAFGPSARFVQQNIVMPGISLGFTVNR